MCVVQAKPSVEPRFSAAAMLRSSAASTNVAVDDSPSVTAGKPALASLLLGRSSNFNQYSAEPEFSKMQDFIPVYFYDLFFVFELLFVSVVIAIFHYVYRLFLLTN